jgi:hypothetical protein
MGLLLFCVALLLYGGQGCQPVRQLGSCVPLGSSTAAAACRIVYIGALSPRLVP